MSSCFCHFPTQSVHGYSFLLGMIKVFLSLLIIASSINVRLYAMEVQLYLKELRE